MRTKEEVISVIYAAIDSLNKQLPEKKLLQKDPGAAIYGENAKLDSLDLFNFVIITEEEIKKQFQVELDIAVPSDDNSNLRFAFYDVGTLSGHILNLLTRENSPN